MPLNFTPTSMKRRIVSLLNIPPGYATDEKIAWCAGAAFAVAMAACLLRALVIDIMAQL